MIKENKMVICDVCNASTSLDEGVDYTADEFRQLVLKGFELDEGVLGMEMKNSGISRDQAIEQWKNGIVAQSASGWLLCHECAKRAAKYNISRQRSVDLMDQSVLSVGAKTVKKTSRAFLISGIFGAIGGIISISVGWIFGIYALIISVIDFVCAYKYWTSPPRSKNNPLYMPILEMTSAVGGSLWCLLIGINNRKRLNSPEVKAYFQALERGVI